MTIQQAPSVDDLLSGGSPILKFPEVGTTHKGTVVRAETTQQTDFDTGKPKFWDNGDPMWQLVLTLQTEDRDESINNDDGQRRLFVKSNMLAGLKAALRSQGAPTIDPGDTIAVKYTGDAEPSRRGLNGAKQFVVQVKKGAGRQAELIDTATDEPPADVADLL